MARSTAKSSRLPWRRAHLSLLAKRQGGRVGDKEEKIHVEKDSLSINPGADDRLHRTSSPDRGRVQRRPVVKAASAAAVQWQVDVAGGRARASPRPEGRGKLGQRRYRWQSRCCQPPCARPLRQGGRDKGGQRRLYNGKIVL